MGWHVTAVFAPLAADTVAQTPPLPMAWVRTVVVALTGKKFPGSLFLLHNIQSIARPEYIA
jgi:hypothetical protein